LPTSKPEGEGVAAAAPSAASDAELQRALANAVEGYALRVREYGDIAPFDREVAPTDVAITAAAILKAAEVYSFEIAAMFNV
jgi:hypothetical protein